MSIVQIIYTLRLIFPFSQLRYEELAIIANVIQYKSYNHKEIIVRKGNILKNLYIIHKGTLQREHGKQVPNIFDFSSVLFDIPIKENIYTHGSESTEILLIHKKYLYTILNECPLLSIGFLDKAVNKF